MTSNFFVSKSGISCFGWNGHGTDNAFPIFTYDYFGVSLQWKVSICVYKTNFYVDVKCEMADILMNVSKRMGYKKLSNNCIENVIKVGTLK